jgi:integrase/recombinase XerD
MTWKRYTESFKQWLQLLNYTLSTTERMPKQIEEFFAWIEKETDHIKSMEQITRQHVHGYYEYLKYTRKSQNTDTFLKSQTLNGHIRALKLFSFYLEETQSGTLTIDLFYEKKESAVREILSVREVQLLYQATGEDHYGMRERAMLHIYYGCGLRSKEGIALDLDDIMLDKKMVYVRQGKNYKERYVPFTEKQKEDFEQYLKYSRPQLIRYENETAFLIGHAGKRISYGILLKALKRLQRHTGDEVLKQKAIGLHALRHSIATHLMQRGMKFDYISQFLGHSNLASTEIYTHLTIAE